MAVARERSSSSSSSETEADLQRFREAAWDPHGNFKKSNLPSAEPSIREKSKDRGQNGHELQTTPEFRAHVAKKLGAILDSSIAILEHTSGPAQNSQKASEAEDNGDIGFRLFSSSVPGDCGKSESVPLRRRRLQHSSSSEQDSDQEWQRCQEAAVSAADILKLSGLSAALQDSSKDHSCQATEPSRKKKKRMKKTAKVCAENGGEEDAVETAHHAQIDNRTEGPLCLGGPCRREGSVDGEDSGLSGNVVMMMMKKKKKKKKKRKTEARIE